MTQANAKRKILIVTSNKALQSEIKTWAEKYIPDSQSIFAHDGSDAILKIQNDSPHLVITSIELAKTDGYQLTEWIIRNKPDEKIAVILLTPVPAKERFVDEVITSKVQFVDLSKGEAEVERVLSKAKNFVFQPTTQQEFFPRSLSQGEQLIKEGEKADNVYLLKSGELEASTIKNQEKIVLGKISAGEFVGEMAYINGENRSADVFALTNCELIAIPAHILDQVLFTKPAWAKALMKTLTNRIKTANKKAA